MGDVFMPKRTILKFEHLRDDVRELFQLLERETDMGVVLIGAAFLDTTIGTLLSQFFIQSNTAKDLLEKGILGDFAVRARLAYVLGLISKDAFRDIVSIAEIRNTFAHHHLALSFNSEDVSTICRKLQYGSETLKVFDIHEDLILPRTRFTLSVVSLSQRLLLDCLQTKRRVKLDPPLKL